MSRLFLISFWEDDSSLLFSKILINNELIFKMKESFETPKKRTQVVLNSIIQKINSDLRDSFDKRSFYLLSDQNLKRLELAFPKKHFLIFTKKLKEKKKKFVIDYFSKLDFKFSEAIESSNIDNLRQEKENFQLYQYLETCTILSRNGDKGLLSIRYQNTELLQLQAKSSANWAKLLTIEVLLNSCLLSLLEASKNQYQRFIITSESLDEHDAIASSTVGVLEIEKKASLLLISFLDFINKHQLYRKDFMFKDSKEILESFYKNRLKSLKRKI